MSDSDIVQDFLIESYENLDRLDRELVGLEKNPHDDAALASVVRTIHTLKGTCGFIGFNQLASVAHVGENLLQALPWCGARCRGKGPRGPLRLRGTALSGGPWVYWTS